MPFQPPATDQIVGQAARGFVPPESDVVLEQRSAFENATETLARSIVRGVPVVGPFLEQGIEHLESMLPEGLGGRPLEQVQARGRQLQAANPALNTAGELAGSLAGGTALVAAAPTLFGACGGSLFTRTVLGAASGAGVGAADTAARGGDALQGAVWGAGGGAIGTLVGSALGRAFARRAATPTSQALKAQAGPLFERARSAGVVVKGDPYRATVTGLAARLKAEGLDPVLHPKASRVLVRLQEAATNNQIDLGTLTTLRRLAGTAGGSLDADERRIGAMMTEALDGFLGKLSAADVLAGDPATVNATLREARQLWSRAAKAEIIEDALERAARVQATGTSELVALRGQFRRIANNSKLMRRFTPDERSAIKAAASEDKLANMLTAIGGLRGMVVGGLGGGFALGPVGGAAASGGLMVTGAVGRGMAARSARQAAQTAQELATTGRLAPQPPSGVARAVGQSVGIAGGLTAGRERQEGP